MAGRGMYEGFCRSMWVLLAGVALAACGGGSDGPKPGEDVTQDTTPTPDTVDPDVTSDVDPVPDTDVQQDPIEPPPDGTDPTDTTDPADTTDTVAFNACGGTSTLTHSGEAAEPGDSCGLLDEGYLVCNGRNGLLCLGESPRNACGGLGVLAEEPGSACGCGGVVVCADDGGVECAGAEGVNACGGCGSLGALGRPGELCTISGGGEGVTACASRTSLVCLDTGRNACGGLDPLTNLAGEALANAAPGDACRDDLCGAGYYVCEDEGRLRCIPTRPCNACGGFAALAGNPGDACGLCEGGRWVCAGGSRVVCSEAGLPNACSGCAPLEAAPGTACTDGQGRPGQWLCDDDLDNVVCVPAVPDVPVNACGGSADLPAALGTPCGSCGFGVWQCDGRNALRCSIPDSEQTNACGGCTRITGRPGTACGTCGSGTVVCAAGNESLRCEGDRGEAARNACGGCGALPGEEGSFCSPCSTWECRADLLVCAPITGLLDEEDPFRCLPRFRTVPAGQFLFGSPFTERYRNQNREVQRSMTLTRPFRMQRVPVTHWQWDQVFGEGSAEPLDWGDCGANCPVTRITWWSALAYANALSVSEGLEPCYQLPQTCTGSAAAGSLECPNNSQILEQGATSYACEGYRLPTEAEWEYAYRAGSTTPYYWADASDESPFGPPDWDDYAWFDFNSFGVMRPVALKRANAWGLFDMAGLVREWTFDWYSAPSALEPEVDREFLATNAQRVVRNGSIGTDFTFLRAANRRSEAAVTRANDLGFRVVQTVEVAP